MSDNETMNHLMVQCPFAAAVWTRLNQRLGLVLAIPDYQSSLAEWWSRVVMTLSNKDQKTANSYIMLVIRALWLERNARVVEAKASTVDRVADAIVDEWRLWAAARCWLG